MEIVYRQDLGVARKMRSKGKFKEWHCGFCGWNGPTRTSIFCQCGGLLVAKFE